MATRRVLIPALAVLAIGVPARAGSVSGHPATPPTGTRAVWSVTDGVVRRTADGSIRARLDELRAAPRNRDAAATATARRNLTAESARDAGFNHVLVDGATTMIPVGDLDGDRLADVVEATISTGTITIRARRGIDGKQLWTFSTPGDYASIRPARLGADGAAGVLLVSYVSQSASDPMYTAEAAADVVTITGLNSAGAKLWERVFAGVDTFISAFEVVPSVGAAGVFGGADVSYPVLRGVYDALPGPADDLLVAHVTDPYAAGFVFGPGVGEGASGGVGVGGASVIDGATGLINPLHVPGVYSDGYTVPEAVPDMSGDKLGDVVHSSAAGEQALLVATKATDPTPLWTSTDARLDVSYLEVTSVGDVTGDGRADLTATAVDGQFLVLSGAAGTVSGAAVGDYVYPLGDANRDGRADIGAAKILDVSKGKITLAVSGYRADGTSLYRTQHTITSSGRSTFFFVEFAEAGDVQADGINDLAYVVIEAGVVVIASPSPVIAPSKPLSGIVDGRTGRVLHRRANGAPVRLAIDARGADLVEIDRQPRGSTTVTAAQGSTGTPLWQTAIRAPVGAVSAAQLTADRCADVLVMVGGDDHTYLLVLGGRDGKVLWGLDVSGSEAKPLPRIVTPGPDRNPGC